MYKNEYPTNVVANGMSAAEQSRWLSEGVAPEDLRRPASTAATSTIGVTTPNERLTPKVRAWDRELSSQLAAMAVRLVTEESKG